RTTTSRAFTSAFTTPFGPMVKLPFVRFSFPSTTPSMYKSSLPVTSPLMRIPALMLAPPRGEADVKGGVLEAIVVPPLVWTCGIALTVEFSVPPCVFASSFFHIGTPRHPVWIFQVAFLGQDGEPRLET